MKAKFYGIELEGTPQEIMEFKKLLDSQYTYKNPYQYPHQTAPEIPYWKWNEIMCGSGTISGSLFIDGNGGLTITNANISYNNDENNIQ